MRTLKIGEVARLAGVGIDTVRYYERRGLLPMPERRPSGYRLYRESSVERLKAVKDLQALGLTLDEIAGLVDAVVDRGAGCLEVQEELQSALGRVETRITALQAIRKQLKAALGRCTSGTCDLADRVKRSARR